MFFKKTKRKNIINQAILDLRNYPPNGFENIDEINSACVFLPEHPSEEFMTAYANVKTKNVASSINIPADKKLVIFNGNTVLNQKSFTENAIHIINGICIIQEIKSEAPIEIFSNGLTIYDDNSRINFIVDNGLSVKVPFEIKHAKTFPVKVNADSLFIENLEDNTVIAAGAKLIICNDVSLELLKSKQIYFAAGSKIECNANILGYVQTIAAAGSKITVNEK